MTPKTLEGLRQMIANESKLAPAGIADYEGVLACADGSPKKYQTFIGWNICRANECDMEWGEFNIKLIQFIAGGGFTEEQLEYFDQTIQIDDDHWNWILKSAKYCTDDYRWFFLYVDGKPQAACLIYFPKDSMLSSNEIFYVEYLAVAPWNRENPMQKRIFLGVGTRILKDVMTYCRDHLQLRPGYSLHSLPKAKKFYQKIGMIYMPEHDKPYLAFYEMPEDVAVRFLEA